MPDARIEETDQGKTVALGSRYLYSPTNPIHRPRLIAQDIPLENHCLYILPSPLLGYGLQELLERLPQKSHILALEISQELATLTASQRHPSLCRDPRITWICTQEKKTLHRILQEMGPWQFRRIRRIDLSSGAVLAPKKYQEIISFLQDNLTSYWRNRYALGRLGRDWIRHIYANVAALSSPYSDLKSLDDLRVEGPIVVVGAGTSLEKNLSFLEKNRKKIWILSTDTALGTLQGAGIKADAVVVLETQAWNLLDFHDSQQSKIPVLADLSAYPPSLHATGGPCYLYSTDITELPFFERLEKAGVRPAPSPPLGTVGITGVKLALALGRGPVLLTGLDFAYKPGKSHARGTAFHRWETSSTHRLCPSLGWDLAMARKRKTAQDSDGSPIQTDAILESYAVIMRDHYSREKRLSVLAPGGINLGLPVLGEKAAEDILLSSLDPKVTIRTGQGKSQDAARNFLKEERALLQKVIEAWEAYAEGKTDKKILLHALALTDQVYIDFPDKPPLPKKNHSFLVRAVSRARKLSRYLNLLLDKEI